LTARHSQPCGYVDRVSPAQSSRENWECTLLVIDSQLAHWKRRAPSLQPIANPIVVPTHRTPQSRYTAPVPRPSHLPSIFGLAPLVHCASSERAKLAQTSFIR